MKCIHCGTDNSTDAVFCRGCGRPLHSKRENQKKGKFRIIKKVLKVIFWLFIIATAIGAIWYFSLPDLKIAPETSKVEFGCEGGSIEIPIYTDAEYSQWHISEPSFVDVTKKHNSIIIKCEENTENRDYNRTGRIALYCDGRNTERVYIEVEQEESDKYVYAKIQDVFVKHNVYEYSSEYDDYRYGIQFTVRCNVRHNQGDKIKCCIWSYHENEEKYASPYPSHSTYTTSGDQQLTVQDEFYPSDSEDEDFVLFIPNSEFKKESGVYFKIGLLEFRTDPSGNEFVSRTFKNKSFDIK